MFVNSNPLNAAEFSNFKNDSEIGNKNYFFPLKTLFIALWERQSENPYSVFKGQRCSYLPRMDGGPSTAMLLLLWEPGVQWE